MKTTDCACHLWKQTTTHVLSYISVYQKLGLLLPVLYAHVLCQKTIISNLFQCHVMQQVSRSITTA